MDRPGCVVCQRQGRGVHNWGITMPGGTQTNIDLCHQHSKPLVRLTTRGHRERRVVGLQGLDELADLEEA